MKKKKPIKNSYRAEIGKTIADYFECCETANRYPSDVGLLNALGVTSLDEIKDIEGKGGCKDLIVKAKMLIYDVRQDALDKGLGNANAHLMVIERLERSLELVKRPSKSTTVYTVI